MLRRESQTFLGQPFLRPASAADRHLTRRDPLETHRKRHQWPSVLVEPLPKLAKLGDDLGHITGASWMDFKPDNEITHGCSQPDGVVPARRSGFGRAHCGVEIYAPLQSPHFRARDSVPVRRTQRLQSLSEMGSDGWRRVHSLTKRHDAIRAPWTASATRSETRLLNSVRPPHPHSSFRWEAGSRAEISCVLPSSRSKK